MSYSALALDIHQPIRPLFRILIKRQYSHCGLLRTGYSQSALQGNNQKLYIPVGLASYVSCQFLYICGIQSCINFVEDKERRRMKAVSHVSAWLNPSTVLGNEPVDGEQKGKSSHRLFTSRKLFHFRKSFTRRHGAIIDTTKIRFLRHDIH